MAVELQKLRAAAIADAQESILYMTKRSNQALFIATVSTAAALPLISTGDVTAIPALASAAIFGVAASVTRLLAKFDANKILKLSEEFKEENKRIIKEAHDAGLIELDEDDDNNNAVLLERLELADNDDKE